MAPKVSHIPPHLLNRVIAGTATAVSYDQRRLGEVSTPPRFDLVVASGDRVMAKVEGKDTLYIAILEHPYIHHTGSDKYIRLPQTYFKLDPECGRATARKDDLLVHIRVAHDDERHLATERFPLVRAAFDGDSLGLHGDLVRATHLASDRRTTAQGLARSAESLPEL